MIKGLVGNFMLESAADWAPQLLHSLSLSLALLLPPPFPLAVQYTPIQQDLAKQALRLVITKKWVWLLVPCTILVDMIHGILLVSEAMLASSMWTEFGRI